MAVRTRGVGVVVHIGPGLHARPSEADMESSVARHAAVVQKITLNHR
jgi:proteasome lid subunit RPN8/RPN11